MKKNNRLPFEIRKKGQSNDELATQLADIVTLNDHTITYSYYPDGNVQTATEKDSSNNTIKTVTYTYNTNGDVATSVTVMNGKTLTTTYNYTNGDITSTSNVIS
jgi:antitoxin component YwqK of YwqJK toxin-antitoxin module